jgi:penicillin-binding protein 1A
MQRFYGLRQRLRNFRKLSKPRQIFIILGLLAIVLIVVAVITTIVFAATLSSKDRIMNRNKTGVSLLDRDGKVFYEFNNAHSDTYVPLSQISEITQKSLISSEDKDFYQHAGFSIPGILNAVWQNVKPGGLDSGGSTITQQLVKMALLTNDRNFFRKYQELILSIEIERRYSKAEILEMYLNSAYFGEGAFGIEDAAKAYFNKSAKDLNLAEASTLIGILPAPSAYSPLSGNPQYTKDRQAYVLRRLVDDKVATQAEADAAKAQVLAYQPQKSDVNIKAPHFALMVKDELEKKYGEETIARSGYKVQTTLNSDWQDRAERIVAQQVDRLAKSNVSNGSVVIVDPKTGQINALVGSKDWFNNQFGKLNIATAGRQPGSSFKPLVYATGIEEKSMNAATIFEDKLTNFGGYTPYNYDRKFRGNVTLRRALANSLNIPAVLAMQKAGVGDVIDTAKSLGITTLTQSPQTYGLPLALGSGQAKLTEMTNAYATFANGGVRNDLQTIISITNKEGSQVYKAQTTTHNAISAQTSFIISSILSDNSTRSEVFGSSLNLSRGRIAAVKTGTTEDYRDAWTIGYTPSLAIGVWIGNNDNTPMSAVAGSSGSGPIWKQLMQEIFGTNPIEKFQQPSGIVSQPICHGTGAIADNPGSNTYNEFFRASALPTDHCNTKAKEEPQEEQKPPEEEEQTPQQNDDSTSNDNDNTNETNPDNGNNDGNEDDNNGNGGTLPLPTNP